MIAPDLIGFGRSDKLADRSDYTYERHVSWRMLSTFEKPFITAFSDNDMVTKGRDLVFKKRIPGTKGQAHVTLKGGRFLQEDSPDDIVTVIDGALTHKSGASG